MNEEELKKNEEEVKRLISSVIDKRDYKSDGKGGKKPIKIKRRPYVVEFSGLPKSGKSTCIEAVKKILSAYGFKVRVIVEKASLCSLDKFDVMFNFWTLSSFVNELNEVLQLNERTRNNDKCDIILCDRGLFDSYVWFTWHYKKKSLLDKDYDLLKNLALWDKFLNKIHSVIILKSKPDDAMKREPAKSLVRDISHSIMKKPVLSSLNSCINSAIKKFKKTNTEIIQVDSVYNKETELKFEVVKAVLKCMDNYYDEKIAYIDKKELKHKLEVGNLSESQTHEILEKELHFCARSDVEQDIGLLQIIPIAVILYVDKKTKNKYILCVRKNADAVEKENNKAPELSKDLFYVGGHIRETDKGETTISTMINALTREISEETGLTLAIKQNVNFKMIYSDDNTKSAKHLAAYIVLTIDIDNMEINLDGMELVQKRGLTNSGKFFNIREMPCDLNLEKWSKLILLNEFSNELNREFVDRCINMKTLLEYVTSN